jgi:subtilisin family serine protease
MLKKIFSFVLIVFAITFMFAGSSNNLLAEGTAPQSAVAGVTVDDGFSEVDALFSKAAEHGSVRVIVGFDVGFQPEGDLLSAAQIENQRLSIDVAQDVVLNSLAAHDVRSIKRFDYIPYMALEVDEAGLDALWRNPDIVSIHEDVPLPVNLAQSVPLINADDVWNRVPEGFDGTGVAVAILDTGVRKGHEFLDDGKVVSEACYSSNDSSSGSETVCPNGKQSQTGSGAGKNCSLSYAGCDHGTHVAGIAAGLNAVSENPTFDGVAKGADIIAVQVFSKFTGPNYCGNQSPCVLSWVSDQIKGLERVYALRDKFNIAAVNMSLGGGYYTAPCDSQPQAAIIKNLRSVGIATVIASGNDGFTNGISSPACISAAISVGATEKDDDVAYFSNYADFLDLLAPGYSILSSIPDTQTDYEYKNGTSMAAPHVAGAFALLRQANFGASVKEIRNALRDTGVPVSDYRNGKVKPRIDVEAALADLGVVRPGFTQPAAGSTIDTRQVQFKWKANGATVQKWELWVGTAMGKSDIYDGPKVDPAVRSKTVDCIPLDGETVYARLRFKIRDKWWYIDYAYATAAGTAPAMVSPSPGVLDDNMASFEWNAGDFCVEAWKLWVGSTAGGKDLYDSGTLPGADRSHTVKGLPYDGSIIYVRLKYKIAGSWQNINATYTAPSWSIGITTINPTPLMSQFTSRDIEFNWADSGGKVTKWRLCIGDKAGDTDYYDSGSLDKLTLQATATRLPRDGRKLYVRLKFKLHGIWEYADYQYKAVDKLPKITDPEPGDTLDDYSVTFVWNDAGHDVQRWRLLIGSAPGLSNYHDSGSLDQAVLSDTCDVLPTDGSKVHVRLKYKKGGVWKYRDYKYTAVMRVPAMDTPAPGSTLPNTSQEFTWQDNNAYVRNYKLWVGSSMGDDDIYDSGTLSGTTTSDTATKLPFDGSTVYVRLKYKSGVKWKYVDYQYTVADTAPEITGPASPLVHSRVTVTWQTRGATVQSYRLLVGKQKGQDDYFNSGKLPGSTPGSEVRQLPINGRTLWVRLEYRVNGVWYHRDYKFKAVTWNLELYSPVPESRLTSSDVTFYWRDNGAPVDKWKLKVGTSVGSSNKFESIYKENYTQQFVSGLPTNGKKIYVRIQAKCNGDVHYKDYWYKTKSSKAYNRFFNNLVCLPGEKKFNATLEICGNVLISKSGELTSCAITNSATCTMKISANPPCAPAFSETWTQTIDNPGCANFWVLDVDSWGNIYVGLAPVCPGNCDTSPPWSGQSLTASPAADSIQIIKKIPVGGGLKSIE